MKRSIIKNLIAWKEFEDRKPLLIEGARQVGKTWVLKEFGNKYFEDFAYFSFDENKNLFDIFTQNISPQVIIEKLSILRGKKIVAGKTFLVLDEIQESNRALNSLKYFMEDMPEQHIACAGSLLGIMLSKPGSFPVGKVHFEKMYPMTFIEFLKGLNDNLLADYLTNKKELDKIDDPIFSELDKRFKQYQITGGMPAVVNSWIKHGDIEKVDRELTTIIHSYELDFAKYPPTTDIPKIKLIWENLPIQLAKKNRKFTYKHIKSGARGREYENALNWLIQAGLLLKINAVNSGKFPLTAYREPSIFKVYLLDVGILRTLCHIPASSILKDNDSFAFSFRGVIAENFVATELTAMQNRPPFYWKSKATAELDFIIQNEDMIIPIEVKSGKSVKAKSMQVYRSRYKTEKAFRFSMKNVTTDDNLTNLPLFLTGILKNFI